MFRRDRRGFTLIELLVVIAIIGILASIVLASLNSARKKSRDARRISDIKQLQLALELYYDAQKGFDGSGTTASYPDTLARLSAAGFIPQVPKDPSSDTNYAYAPLVGNPLAVCVAATAPCTSYHVGASLAESSNPALKADADNLLGFLGTDGNAEGVVCDAVAGGTETCYDVIP